MINVCAPTGSAAAVEPKTDSAAPAAKVKTDNVVPAEFDRLEKAGHIKVDKDGKVEDLRYHERFGRVTLKSLQAEGKTRADAETKKAKEKEAEANKFGVLDYLNPINWVIGLKNVIAYLLCCGGSEEANADNQTTNKDNTENTAKSS